VEDELLGLIKEALDEKQINYMCAEGRRIIVRFDGDYMVCMYKVIQEGILFRAFFDIRNAVPAANRINVLECLNSINVSLTEGTFCIDEQGCIVYLSFIEYSGWGSISKQKIRRAIRITLEAERDHFGEIKKVMSGENFESGAQTVSEDDSPVDMSAFLAECSDDMFMAYYKKDLNRIGEALYGENIPDNEVLWQVYEGEKRYKNEGYIANYVIMGGPGSGKTTLAKKLANYIDAMLDDEKMGERRLMIKSVADLKGAHVGQTGNRVFDLLKEASEKKRIIFIDEAYQLLSDDFGKEALSVLLPVMSGDRDEIEKVVKDGREIFSFSKHGQWVPPIWLGGYEDETRSMVNRNTGLYRRASMISLSKPKVEELYQCLRNLCKENDVLKEVIEQPENQKVITGYFAWGMQPEHMAYFACYAGVESLYGKLNTYLAEDMSEEQLRMFLTKVVKDSMKEIERQSSIAGGKN